MECTTLPDEEMNTTIAEISKKAQELYFGWLDFTVFGLMLALSTVVGIYYGFWDKQVTKVQYLLGGRSLSILPVAASLVASYISGITLIGVPGEIYTRGTLYILACVANIFIALLMIYVFLPIFFELQLTSTYEYMEMRFNRSVRIMCSALYTIAYLLFLPVVIYIPALALSQVTGFNIHIISPVVGIICIFYTMMGGMKAVVWTDFIQSIVMLGSSIAVVILGVYNVGGVATVFQRSNEGGRLLLFEMDPSITARNTFWTILIGTFAKWLGTSTNQAMVQKYMSLPSLRNAKITAVLVCVGIIVLKCLSIFTGLILYATYHDCDPIKAQVVKRADQLLVYFVMDTGNSIPGLPGLFIAGVFSGALSTLSTILNCLAGVISEDIIQPFLQVKDDERRDEYIMKSLVVVLGVISLLLVLAVEKLGTMIEITYCFFGITIGAVLGMLTLGVFFPWANSKGALWGSLCSLALVSIMSFGAQYATATGKLSHRTLPTSVEGCYQNLTETEIRDIYEEDKADVFFLFRISYWYFGVIGTLTVVIVGMTVSYFTGFEEPSTINQSLIAPFLRKHITKRDQPDVNTLELAEKLLKTSVT